MQTTDEFQCCIIHCPNPSIRIGAKNVSVISPHINFTYNENGNDLGCSTA